MKVHQAAVLVRRFCFSIGGASRQLKHYGSIRQYPSPPRGHVHAHGGVLPSRVWVSCVNIARPLPLPPMCHNFTARRERQRWCPFQAARPSSTPPAHAQLFTTCHAPGNAVLRSRGEHSQSRCTRSSYLRVPCDSQGHLRVFSSARLAHSTSQKAPCGGNPHHAWGGGSPRRRFQSAVRAAGSATAVALPSDRIITTPTALVTGPQHCQVHFFTSFVIQAD